MNVSHIAWIDVESTGVNPYGADSLLEVACYVTDWDLNKIEEEGFRRVLKYSTIQTEILRTRSPKFVQNMHEKTGLWDALPTGTSPEDVDEELLEYLKAVNPNPHSMVLGGNSITLDRGFLDTTLPETFEFLHYRSIDVTTISLLAQNWFGASAQYQGKTGTHAALTDISESIDELRFLRETVFRKP